jgi:hypothetical protein
MSLRLGIFFIRAATVAGLGPELQASSSDRRSGACHVDPSGGRPIGSKRLFEILEQFADWLGLRAHTLSFSGGCHESKIVMGKMVCLYNNRH